ncbi:D-glucuronyl C5-epimerase family protein [Roseisolibacter sp. H3M3-2]|uniref:D-glucuronyl C5-epimerase family protein n=1 Tax=Roseisolibacter sp. H3M3-2 TaxID=3031323 RepID=UPI0023DB9FFD|nr:D-glucuronyl C5-epimerase family protein [Roseisolibacter sp. H3M3-2]MDF1502346.1 D-glucuronyl C5-epimerase family protein [Roseisolibacter sp. H3M3-2]
MRKSLALMWHDVRAYATGDADVRAADWAADPWRYPTDWSALLPRVDEMFGPFDDAGLPLQPAGGRHHHNPSRIAGWALLLWNARPEGWRERFLAAARWFAEQPDGRFAYTFDAGPMRAPWLSCIGQGQGLSVLTRAAVATRDDAWLDAARRAVPVLGVPVAEGGLLDRLPDGSPFLEEYPGSYAHVLNGCLHALVGLDDLARAGDDAGVALRDAVLAATAANVGRWDAGGWSTYDLGMRGRAPNLATLNYHRVHAIFLRYLAGRHGLALLAAAAERWEAGAARPAARGRALLGKLRYRLAEGW